MALGALVNQFAAHLQMVGAVVGVLGAMVMWLGLRGRVIGVGPVCRACGFSLEGLIAGAAKEGQACPECGAALNEKGAVREGLRRRRPVVIAVGGLLLLMAAATMMPAARRLGTPSGWMPWMPVGVVSNLVETADGELFAAAVNEADARAAAGGISVTALGTLARGALARQAGTMPWDPLLGSLIERAFDAGAITPAEGAAFLKRTLTVSALPRAASQPATAEWSVELSTSRAGPNQWGMKPGYESVRLRTVPVLVRLKKVELNGETLPVRRTPGPGGDQVLYSFAVLNPRESGRIGTSESVAVPAAGAEGTLRVTYELRFDESIWNTRLKNHPRDRPFMSVTTGWPPFPEPGTTGVVSQTWTETLTIPFEPGAIQRELPRAGSPEESKEESK
ncbi:MAG: hypothetical protein JSR77_00210 [Planctomycetes bacterium]|nr:hypothetical protein [Planctomycetota bacterium]